jgi:hypothetical protein
LDDVGSEAAVHPATSTGREVFHKIGGGANLPHYLKGAGKFREKLLSLAFFVEVAANQHKLSWSQILTHTATEVHCTLCFLLFFDYTKPHFLA